MRVTRCIAAALSGLLAACLGDLRDAIEDATPREQYEAALDASGLAGSAAVRDWKAAALRARDSALALAAPFHESGYFAPERAEARGYLIQVRRGQQLTARFTLRGERAARLFVDLYEVPEAGSTTFDHLASADSGAAELVHEIRRDGAVILVLQPELLSGGRYELEASLEPTLGFPVTGHDPDAIRSRFGADRDAGRRRHEGVDIFAPRGTPVIAAAGGLATWVGTNELGGNVVMLRDRERGEGHYYAHLDTQLVTEGTIVSAGDTLGLVGNSGNARTTPPHLHFGIYARGRGAVDPLPYLVPPDSFAGPPPMDLERLGEWMRLSSRADLAPAPGAEGGPVFEAGTVVRVLGATGSWFRAELPDGTTGFIAARRLVPAEPIAAAAPGAAVLERPDSLAIVVDTTSESARAEVLGRFLAYDFVRFEDGTPGWIERRAGR
ncbi:MAG TPA: M23 family metallopeptidase [Gemmatimonadales bacterium]|nr:M23 family metallopeptidase [Gemmatimonadales bacterium]